MKVFEGTPDRARAAWAAGMLVCVGLGILALSFWPRQSAVADTNPSPPATWFSQCADFETARFAVSISVKGTSEPDHTRYWVYLRRSDRQIVVEEHGGFARRYVTTDGGPLTEDSLGGPEPEELSGYDATLAAAEAFWELCDSGFAGQSWTEVDPEAMGFRRASSFVYYASPEDPTLEALADIVVGVSRVEEDLKYVHLGWGETKVYLKVLDIAWDLTEEEQLWFGVVARSGGPTWPGGGNGYPKMELDTGEDSTPSNWDRDEYVREVLEIFEAAKASSGD